MVVSVAVVETVILLVVMKEVACFHRRVEDVKLFLALNVGCC